MSTDNLDLDALRGLLDVATQGPWDARGCQCGCQRSLCAGNHVDILSGRHGLSHLARSNADLIVALVNAAPALITAARERDAVVEAVTIEHDIAHAVALERNRCLDIIDEQIRYGRFTARSGGHLEAVWLEDRAGIHMMEGFRVAVVRQKIAGHNPQTPTSGDSSALSLNGSVERSPRQSGDAPGPVAEVDR